MFIDIFVEININQFFIKTIFFCYEKLKKNAKKTANSG